jgi:hypothetical protein
MPYRLSAFSAVALPAGEAEFDAGTPPADERIVATLGGGFFDAYGANGAPLKLPQEISYKCETTAASLATLRTTYEALAGKVGARRQLWRTAAADLSQQWCWARLMQVAAPRKYGQVYWQPLELRFKQLSIWHGTAYNGDDENTGGYLWSNGLYQTNTPTALIVGANTYALTNDGNHPVTDAGIYLVAGTGLTQAQFVSSAVDFTIADTFANGEVLRVDCGTHGVTLDGADAYSLFSLGAGHRSPYWLEIPAGGTELEITLTGGGASVAVVHYDGWA